MQPHDLDLTKDPVINCPYCEVNMQCPDCEDTGLLIRLNDRAYSPYRCERCYLCSNIRPTDEMQVSDSMPICEECIIKKEVSE